MPKLYFEMGQIYAIRLEYQNALKDVGMGHESVEEELKFLVTNSIKKTFEELSELS